MAVSKFSQIPTSANPSINDFVLGVTANNQDQRFPIVDLVPAVPAQSSLDFYVSTTGSDLNPGTISQPFATIQHALNVAAKFDYQGVFQPTIHIADGTYQLGPIGAGTPSITLPALINPNPPGGFITGNAVSPGNVVLWDNGGGFGPIIQATQGANCQWVIGGVTFDEEFFVTLIGQGATLQVGDSTNGAVHLADRSGGTFQSFINLNGDGGQILVNFSITYTGTNLGQAINTNVGGPASIFWNAAVNFQPGSTWGAQSSVDSNVFVQQQTTTFSNPPAGGGLFMAAFSSFFYRATATHFFFGDGGIEADPSCTVENNDGFGGIFAVQASGPPTTTTVPIPGTGNFHKDTSGGNVYAAYNDGGTIKKVQLT